MTAIDQAEPTAQAVDAPLLVGTVSADAVVLDAERSVLGALMTYPDAIGDVDLVPGDFLLPRHQLIYRAVVQAFADHDRADPLLVGNELKHRGRLLDAGGTDYLFDLLGCVVSAVGIAQHAEILKDGARVRRIEAAAQEILLRVRDGGDAEELLAGAQRLLEGVPRTAPEPRRTRSWLDVATDPPVDWIVEGVVARGGLTVLAGGPGVGKTLVAIDMSLRLAHGMPFLGRECMAASTLYLAAEGSLGARMRAWRAAHLSARQMKDRFVAIDDVVPDLTQPAGHRELEELIQAVTLEHGHLDVLIIDTLAAALPGLDENDSSGITALMATLAQIRKRFGVAIMLLHHPRKPQANSPKRVDQHDLRGSGALAGAVDVVLIAVDGDEVRTLHTVKARDAEKLKPMNYVVRAQDTGLALKNGRPEFGPVALPAAEQVVAPALVRSLDEQAQDRRAAIVAKVREMGSAPSANSVVGRLEGRRPDMLAAFREAVDLGELVNVSKDRDQKRYVVADSVCVSPPHPPVPGTGNHLDGGPVPDGERGREPAEPPTEPQGTTPEPAREPVVTPSDPDDGLSEKPKGKRRPKGNGKGSEKLKPARKTVAKEAEPRFAHIDYIVSEFRRVMALPTHEYDRALLEVAGHLTGVEGGDEWSAETRAMLEPVAKTTDEGEMVAASSFGLWLSLVLQAAGSINNPSRIAKALHEIIGELKTRAARRTAT